MQPNRIKYLLLGRVVGFFILGMVILPNTVAAHRVTLFAWVEGTTVHTQSRFAGGRAVKNGDITVFDAKGNRLLSGKTDDKGAFTFEMAAPSGARITLDAGMGHGNEWVITNADQVNRPVRNDHAPDIQPNAPPAAATTPGATTPFDKADPETTGSNDLKVNQVIEEIMDKKLKPIMLALSEIQDPAPSVRDVLGGIGYIIGLVGLGAYMQSRRNGQGRRDDNPKA